MQLEKIDISEIEGVIVATAAVHCEMLPFEIKPEHFNNPLYSELWSLMLRLKSKGDLWDLCLLYQATDSISCRAWLRDFVPDILASEALQKFYMKYLKDNYRKRLTEKVIREVDEEFGYHEPFEIQSRLSKKLAEDETENTTKSFREAALEVCRNLEIAKEEGGITGITTGMRNLDAYFNGFQPSRLYILAARPSMGKSALMLNFALNAAKASHSIYIHCLEESMDAFTKRALSHLTGIDNEAIQRGRFRDDQWSGIHDGVSKLSNLPVFINETANITAEQICNSVRAHHLRFPIEMVFVDHIQDLRRKSDNWHHDISEAAGLFKQLAKDLKIPVLIVSQLNRSVEQSANKKPALSHLKESGDIEAKADVIMLLFREAYYNPNVDKSLAELLIGKNRDGRTGNFYLHWNAEQMKFGERLVA